MFYFQRALFYATYTKQFLIQRIYTSNIGVYRGGILNLTKKSSIVNLQ